MKLIQAMIFGTLSTLSVAALANEAAPTTEPTLGAALVQEAPEAQPVIVTTQAEGVEDTSSAAAEAQAEQPATEAAAEESEHKDTQK